MDTPQTGTALPIVVGIDGSEGSERALRWAAAQAVRTGAPLRLVGAWEPPVSTSYATLTAIVVDPTPFTEAAADAVRRAEHLVREELGDRTPPVEGVTVQGTAASVLLEQAEGASLLVVGTRGRGGLASAVLGSVSTTCSHHTPVPLAIIGADAPAPGSGDLVVGYDGSSGARAALHWAVGDARLSGAAVRVVHGWSTSVGEPFGVLPDGSLIDDPTPEVEQEVREAVADVADPPPLTVEVDPLPGARAVLARAEGAAALVLGTRGHGGFVGLLLGSVTSTCLHHSPCPLIIVPEG